jgi:hypothetical protein
MKNVAPNQLDQFDKMKLSPLPFMITKVNSGFVKILLSTTDPRVSVWKL